jgi:hypothetical protein
MAASFRSPSWSERVYQNGSFIQKPSMVRKGLPIKLKQNLENNYYSSICGLTRIPYYFAQGKNIVGRHILKQLL